MLPALTFAEVRFRPVLAGQKTAGQREVGNRTDLLPFSKPSRL
jgi:hypothetical protein